MQLDFFDINPLQMHREISKFKRTGLGENTSTILQPQYI